MGTFYLILSVCIAIFFHVQLIPRTGEMKKVLSIISIVAGGLLLLSVIAPMIIGTVLTNQMSDSVGIIGGADGPTAVFVVGTFGAGSVIIESVVGVLLIAVGIWCLIRCKK